jgi:hypothetical protein
MRPSLSVILPTQRGCLSATDRAAVVVSLGWRWGGGGLSRYICTLKGLLGLQRATAVAKVRQAN